MFLKNIFSIKNQHLNNNKHYKVITVLGFKIKIRSNRYIYKRNWEELANSIQELQQKNESLSIQLKTQHEHILNLKNSFSSLWQIQRVKTLHSQVFPKFKNIHTGKDVVIVATGPSLNDYTPIENAIHMGVNTAYKKEGINLDYLFMQDYLATCKYIEDTFPYKNEKLIRFYGIQPTKTRSNFVIPESIAIKHSALRYYAHSFTSETPELPDTFAYDLNSEELYGKGSTVFSAINFALWTNPKRIYLVGCDCSSNGHFDLNDNTKANENLLQYYILLKKFTREHYPDTEIISINPVGLKGIFKDIYTK